MIGSVWAPMFAPLPGEVRRAADHCAAVCLVGPRTGSNPAAQCLPVEGGLRQSDTPAAGYGAISRGKIELAKEIGLF